MGGARRNTSARNSTNCFSSSTNLSASLALPLTDAVLMPRLFFPEFIQQDATPHNIAQAGLEPLRNENLRSRLKERLAGIVGSLGGPGASRRAARAIKRKAAVLLSRSIRSASN